MCGGGTEEGRGRVALDCDPSKGGGPRRIDGQLQQRPIDCAVKGDLLEMVHSCDRTNELLSAGWVISRPQTHRACELQSTEGSHLLDDSVQLQWKDVVVVDDEDGDELSVSSEDLLVGMMKARLVSRVWNPDTLLHSLY